MTDNANRYNIFAAGCTVVLSFALAMLVYLAGIRPFDYSLAVYGIMYALPLLLMAGGVYFGCASANGRRAERLPVYVIIVVMLLAVISDGRPAFRPTARNRGVHVGAPCAAARRGNRGGCALGNKPAARYARRRYGFI